MMGSERVVGTLSSGADGNAAEVSGIVPQSLVELFRLLDERSEAGSGEEGETETWKVRVSYLQVILVCVVVESQLYENVAGEGSLTNQNFLS